MGALVLAITRVYNCEICGTSEAGEVKENVAKPEKERKREERVGQTVVRKEGGEERYDCKENLIVLSG